MKKKVVKHYSEAFKQEAAVIAKHLGTTARSEQSELDQTFLDKVNEIYYSSVTHNIHVNKKIDKSNRS